MRNFRVIFILFICSLLLTTSCKRGEDDPFLSLRSRDGRISGEWLISNIGGSETNKTVYHSGMLEGNSTTTVTSHSFSGFLWMQTITTTNVSADETVTNTVTDSYYHNVKLTIDKDGSLTQLQTDEDGNETSKKGRWYWANSNKKKIGITFDFDFESYTFNIRQLKNKELVLENIGEYYDDSDYSTYTENYETFFTYEKQ